MAAPTEKLQKVLAQTGLGSRREIERWIAAGEVSVNGKPATTGQRVTGTERITVRGKPVRLSRDKAAAPRVILYHKPAGEIVSRDDPEGRPTIFKALPRVPGGRWIAVGRLDINTCGLLLLTTDGELANRLMHPSSELVREYAVRVLGEVDDAMIRRLTRDVELEDGPARFEQVTPGGGEGANKWFRVTLREGRKREVRRLWESQGLRVNRLIRIRFGPIQLERELNPGKWRELRPGELSNLYGAVGLPTPNPPTEGAFPSESSRIQ